MNAIELSHVCKHFPGFSIQDLTFAVPSGTICGLVGENGAGKSTTIRLLMGALRPDSGTCSALGVDTSSPEFLAIKEDVGVVLDEAYFPEVLNADQVGRVMTRTYQRWDAKVYAAYLRRFDLPLKKAFKDFSRGMRMKLSIAVALSHSPKLLVLDEATAGLDPIVRDEVLEIFNEFTREEDHSILISSHILSDLEKLVIISPFSTRDGCCFARRKTSCWTAMACSLTRPSRLKLCSRRPLSPRSPMDMAASDAWSAGTWPPPVSSWNGPR